MGGQVETSLQASGFHDKDPVPEGNPVMPNGLSDCTETWVLRAAPQLPGAAVPDVDWSSVPEPLALTLQAMQSHLEIMAKTVQLLESRLTLTENQVVEMRKKLTLPEQSASSNV